MSYETFAAILIGLAVGILIGAVSVYAAWQAENDRRKSGVPS